MNRFIPILVSSLLVTWSGNAWSGNDPVSREASTRFKAGVQYSNRGQWEQARLAFLQAYAVDPTTNTLWNLAYAELKSGHALEALEHFDTYESRSDASRKDLAALPQFREEAFKKIGRLLIKAPSGAHVWIDGDPRDATTVIYVSAGAHKVKAQVGESAEERPITLSPGQVLELEFSAPPTPARPETAVAAPPVPEAVLVAPPVSSPPPPADTPVPSRRANLTLGWVGLGVTAGALGAGIGFALLASSKADEIDSAHSPTAPYTCSMQPVSQVCMDRQDAIDKHDTYRQISTVSFIAASVLGAASVGYLILAPRRSNVALAPYTSGKESGFMMRSSF